MKNAFPFVVVLFFLNHIILAQIPLDSRLGGLDTFVQRVLDDWKAPGVAIAVVEKDKVIYAGGFGYRNYAEKLPVTENTLFAIGSCTKAFTASMLGMLVKEGKIDLDKPVRDYLPELKFKNEYANTHVTLRDMMTHRTGLPRHDFSWYGSTASRHELLERVQYLKPSAELREKYQYNNFMFMAQGIVLEQLTGKSWEDNLKERIFEPLRMVQSNMSTIDLEKSSDHSLAYTTQDFKIEVIPFRNIDAIGPAGSINSSAKDMANWLLTWVNDGSFEGKEIIPSSFRNQAISPQMATGGGLPGSENQDVHMNAYGLGWGMSSYRGHYRVEHGGGIDGFITSTCFFPSDSLGIFVVSNQGAPTSAIRNFIADRMLNLTARNWSQMQLTQRLKADSLVGSAPNNDSLNQIKGTMPSHALVDYSGSYDNKGYGVVKVFIENDTTWIDYNEAGKRTKSYLEHYHYDVFRTLSTEEKSNNKNAPKINFNSDDRGMINSFAVQLEPSVEKIVFEKLPPDIEITEDELQKYVGDYDLTGVTVKVYIRGDGVLMVLVPGQPDYELIAAQEHEFRLKVAEGYSVKFEVDDQELVQSLSFVQPNGVFKAVRK